MEKFTSIQESNDYKKSLAKSAEGITKLSILIATTVDRRVTFNFLMQEFHKQIDQGGWKGAGLERWQIELPKLNEVGERELDEKGKPVMILVGDYFRHPDVVQLAFIEDNKEISIGAKRNALLEKATGNYIVFFDSDDMPRPGYVKEIMTALASEPDCIGFKIAMTTDGKDPKTCIHSLRNRVWEFKNDEYLRNVTHFNPVKRSLAVQVGFPDLRFGEDKVYSDVVSKICKHEVFIDKFLFDYRYSTAVAHDLKYGFIQKK